MTISFLTTTVTVYISVSPFFVDQGCNRPPTSLRLFPGRVSVVRALTCGIAFGAVWLAMVEVVAGWVERLRRREKWTKFITWLQSYTPQSTAIYVHSRVFIDHLLFTTETAWHSETKNKRAQVQVLSTIRPIIPCTTPASTTTN